MHYTRVIATLAAMLIVAACSGIDKAGVMNYSNGCSAEVQYAWSSGFWTPSVKSPVTVLDNVDSSGKPCNFSVADTAAQPGASGTIVGAVTNLSTTAIEGYFFQKGMKNLRPARSNTNIQGGDVTQSGGGARVGDVSSNAKQTQGQEQKQEQEQIAAARAEQQLRLQQEIENYLKYQSGKKNW